MTRHWSFLPAGLLVLGLVLVCLWVVRLAWVLLSLLV